ncbi:MAG: cation:proton antiporter [Pseudomonadota bacterium]
MEKLSHLSVVSFLFSISTILIVACLMSELAKKVKCPGVVGELLAGILLGPTIFGTFFPEYFQALYQDHDFSIALDGVFNLSAIIILFVAGAEIKLDFFYKHIKVIMCITFFGFLLPFLSGFLVVWYFPTIFFSSKNLTAAIFLGTALSISALPVIARILMDIEMVKTKLGAIIIASAMLTDMIGWGVFSLTIKSYQHPEGNIHIDFSLFYNLAFFLIAFIAIKYCITKLLPWFLANPIRDKYILPLILGVSLLLAAYTESMNLNASLGAFLAGILFNKLLESYNNIKQNVELFVIGFFSPLFFSSVGLQVNFIKDFNLQMTFIIILLAFVSKIAGASLGSFIAGFSAKDSVSISFGLSARGAMGIILCTIALHVGLINSQLFVALVMMALITSVISGFMLKALHNPNKNNQARGRLC